MNYYDLLGVPEDATYEEIRKSYRELAKKYHPDVNAAKNANYLFVQINDAYNILSNPLSREEYDRFNRYNLRAYSHKTYSDVEREESMKWKNRNNGSGNNTSSSNNKSNQSGYKRETYSEAERKESMKWKNRNNGSGNNTSSSDHKSKQNTYSEAERKEAERKESMKWKNRNNGSGNNTPSSDSKPEFGAELWVVGLIIILFLVLQNSM